MSGSGVDDVSTQLGLTNQLLQTNQLISEVLERITGQYAQQLDLLRRMNDVMSEMNTDVFRRISDEALDAMDSITELTDTMIDLNDVLLELDDSYIVADRSQRQFSDNVVRGARRGVKENENLTENLYTLTKVYDKLKKKTKEYFNALARTSVPLLAIQGLVKGFSNLFAVVGAGISIIGAIASAVAKFAFAVIMFPFKVFKGIIDLAASTDSNLYQIFEKLKGVFGDLNGPTASSIITTAKNMAGFEQTGLSAMRVFGTFGERMELLLTLAQEMGPAFMKLQSDFKGSEGVALAYQKGLGLVGDEMKTIATRAQAFGINSEDIFKDITKQAYGLGKAFGIDAKILGKDVAKALKDVAHFGNASVKQLAQAAAYARGLGTELEKIVGVMDAFDSFEDAATNASKLNQYLGIQVDAFKMMAAETPDEKLNMLRTAMLRTGKSAESLDRFQLRLLSSTVGLDAETTRLAFSMKNQGLSLEQIKKQGSGLEKKTLTQEEAMSKLADAIDKLVKAQEGGFFNQFLSGIGAGIQDTKEFQQALYEIKGSLQSAYEWGINFGKMIVQKFPAIREMIIGLGKLFSPEKFGKLLDGIGKSFEGFIRDMTTGDISLGKLIDSLKKNFFSWFDSTKAGSGLLKAVSSLMKGFSEAIAQGIEIAGQALADGMMSMANIVSGKKPLPGLAQDGQNFLTRSLGRIGSALMTALEKMWPAFKEFTTAMLKKIGEIIMSPELAGVRNKIMMALAAVTFGPAFLQMGLGMLAKTLMGAGPAIANTVSTAAAAVPNVAAATPGGVSPTIGGVCSPSITQALSGGKTSPLSPQIVGSLSSTNPADLKTATAAMPAVKSYLGAFAGMVAIGLAAFFVAVGLIKAFNVKPEDVKSAGIAMVAIGATVLLMTPALKLMAIPIPGGELNIMKTMKTLAGILIAGLIPFGMALGLVKGVKIEDVMSAGMVLAVIPGIMAIAAGAAWAAAAAGKAPPAQVAKGVGAIVGIIAAGLGLAGLAAAIIQSSGVKKETIEMTSSLLTSMIPMMLSAAAVVAAAYFAGQAAEKGKQYITQGMVSMAIVIGAMAGTAIIISGLLSFVKPEVLQASGIVLDSVASAFLKASAVVFALMAIGALSASTAMLSDASVLAGLISLGTVIGAMVGTVLAVVEILDKMTVNPGELKIKAEAFAAVMTTVVNFTAQIAEVMKATNFTFDSQEDIKARLQESTNFVKTIATEATNLMITSLLMLKNITKKDANAASAVGPLLSAVSSLMGSLSDGAAKLVESESSWIIPREIEHEHLKMAIGELSSFISVVGGEAIKLSKEIVKFVSEIPTDQLKILKYAGAGFSAVLNGVASFIKSASPAVESFKTTITEDVLWGAAKVSVSGFDVEAFKKYALSVIETMQSAKEPLLDFVSSVIKLFTGFKIPKEAVELAKEIGPIIGSVGTMMNSITSSFKENVEEIEKPDKEKVKKITVVVPPFRDILREIKEHFPVLIEDMLGIISRIQIQRDTKKKLSTLSSIFELISKVPEIVNSINEISAEPVASNNTASSTRDMFKSVNNYLEGLLTSNSIERCVELIRLLGGKISFGDSISVSRNAKKLSKFIGNVNSVLSSINQLSEIGTKDGEPLEPPDFTNLNNYLDALEKSNIERILERLQGIFQKFSVLNNVKIPDISKPIEKINANLGSLTNLSEMAPSLEDVSPVLPDISELERISRSLGAVTPVQGGNFDLSHKFQMKPMPGISSKLSDSADLSANSGNIVINIAMDVHMDTMEIESKILSQPKSQIRMRLNRALNPNVSSYSRAVPSQELLQPISTDTLGKVSPPPADTVELARSGDLFNLTDSVKTSRPVFNGTAPVHVRKVPT